MSLNFVSLSNILHINSLKNNQFIGITYFKFDMFFYVKY